MLLVISLPNIFRFDKVHCVDEIMKAFIQLYANTLQSVQKVKHEGESS